VASIIDTEVRRDVREARRVSSASNAYEAVATREAVVDSPEFEARLDEIVRRMELEGVEGVYFQVSSVDGRVLGKLIMRAHFKAVARAGIRLHYAAVTDARVDLWGDLIGFGEQTIEGLGIPDLETFRVLPWEPRLARVWCHYYEEAGGGLLEHDVRGNLRRVEDVLYRETGLTMLTGIEPEMMWLRKGPDGSLSHATSADALYNVTQFGELEPVFLEVAEFARSMGLDLSHGDHEDASQIEFNQSPGTPLEHADALVTYRQICRVVGQRHGLIACFMPKPFMQVSGNGHHHNVSLVDDAGDNRIIGDLAGACRLSAEGLGFVGGILEHADALTLVGSPSVNSYKRFWDVGYWAPFHKSYDYNNRTVLLRVSAPGRLEIRHFDSSCNPYLTLAGVAMAAVDGIKRGLDPGPPNTASAEMDLRVPREQRVPLHLLEAIEAFEADPLMKEAFPPSLYEAFLALRRDEWTRYCAQVSQWETDFYLERYP
jgi:glutamine synthetase